MGFETIIQMNIAILISGSLRTFFKKELFDNFVQNIIECNKSHNLYLFAHTDTNDFYYDGIQYFSNTKVDKHNSNDFRINENIEHISIDDAKTKIKSYFDDIKKYFNHLTLTIDEYQEPDDRLITNELHKIFVNSNHGGSSQLRCLSQFKKVKSNHNCLLKNKIHYDCIFKTRFDLFYRNNFNFDNYNLNNNTLYVPGIPAQGMVYDWFAYGSKNVMDIYCNLYENFGITIQDNKKSLECHCKCGGRIIDYFENWKSNVLCENCKTIKQIYDITNSAELTTSYYMSKNNINCVYKGPGTFIYRYKN